MTTSTRRLSCRPLYSGVAGDGMKLGVAGSRQPLGGDAVLLDQHLAPVAVARAVDSSQLEANCEVWMGTLSVWPSMRTAQACSCRMLGDAARMRPRARLDGGRSAVEETDLAQADHQTVGFHVEGNLIAPDLAGQRFLQFAADGLELLLDRLQLLLPIAPAREC